MISALSMPCIEVMPRLLWPSWRWITTSGTPPAPRVHAHFAPPAALVVPDEQRTAAAIEIRLSEAQRFLDAQPGAPQHHDHAPGPVTVRAVAGGAHDGDDLFDGGRAWRAAGVKSRHRRRAIRRRPARSSSSSHMSPPRPVERPLIARVSRVHASDFRFAYGAAAAPDRLAPSRLPRSSSGVKKRWVACHGDASGSPATRAARRRGPAERPGRSLRA
jgi:hypothetical protein